MIISRHALVVIRNPRLARVVVGCVTRAGYSARVLDTFAAGRAALDAAPPDLLVAAIKLEAHNALHLAIRCRSRGVKMPIVLIGDPDPVLENEARRIDATYLTEPLDEARLFAVITSAGAEYRPARRSPRKRVPNIPARVGEVDASVLDVSYEGLRLQVEANEADAIPPFFQLRIPRYNLTFRAQRVWTRSPPAVGEGLWCGAAIISADAGGAVAWRMLVDSVPGWTLLAH